MPRPLPRPAHLATLLSLLFALVPSSSALAQRSGGAIDLQRFRPPIDSKGYLTLDASQPLTHLAPSFGLVASYARRPLSLRGPAGHLAMDSRYTVEQLVTAHLQAALGLFGRLEVGLSLPLTFWSGDSDPDASGGPNEQNPDTGALDAQGVGDLGISLKARLLDTSRFPVGVALALGVTLPTGDDARFLGAGEAQLSPKLIVDTELLGGRLRLVSNVGATLALGGGGVWRDERSCSVGAQEVACGTGKQVEVSHRLRYGVGAALSLLPGRLEVMGEVIGELPLGGESDLPRYAHELLLGLRLYLAPSSYMALGVGRGLRGGWGGDGHSVGSPDLRAFLGVVFEPGVGDRDGDGIKDDVDRCPSRPEDIDDFEDQDGCPDPDNDKDGIPDRDDRCPLDPEDKDGQDDDDGCPEPDRLDRDGDGIPDAKDKCPDDPEDKDRFEDQNGCPDPDNDKDGILDVDDLCPDEPEDKDGFEDKDGCPDPDNDKDRILDVDDKCPNEPETYNGYQDKDGCPDRVVRVGPGKLFVMKKIYFETNSAVIRKVSLPTLAAVAHTLRHNPQLLKLEIQGHADERGSDLHNLRLTSARAESVRRHLIGLGISAKRLKARGYGERKPLDRRHTPEAWSNNRRVEFVIRKRL